MRLDVSPDNPCRTPVLLWFTKTEVAIDFFDTGCDDGG